MIKVICVGKLKEKYLVDAVKEYSKRISKYSNIQIIEVNDSNVDNEKIALEREKELILKHINTKDYIITLEIDGKQLTSIEFASKIDEIFIHNSNITFIIGGTLGLYENVLKNSNELICFSKMTFPHGLFRGILLEQIYRACKINNHEMYHK